MYTQNVNNIRELLKPAISIPIGITVVIGLYWIIQYFRIAADKSVIIFFFVMLLVIVGGVFGLSFSISNKIEMRSRKKWPGTVGTITRSACEKSSYTTRTSPNNVNNGYSEVTVFVPKVSYRYKVDDIEYEGNNISGPTTEGFKTSEDAEQILKPYPVGRKVMVFYSPRKHKVSVLEKSAPQGIDLAFISGIIFLIGGLFISWVLSAYVNNGCKTLEAHDVFDVGPAVTSVLNRSAMIAGSFIEKHPSMNEKLITLKCKIDTVMEKRRPRYHKPHLSKKEMNYQIKLFNDVHQDNEFARLDAVIGVYEHAHWFSKAIENAEKLIEITSDDFSKNWSATELYTQILTESDRLKDAEQVLKDFSVKWKDELEQESISIDSVIIGLQSTRLGKPVEYSKR